MLQISKVNFNKINNLYNQIFQIQIKDNLLKICYLIKDYLKDQYKFKHKNLKELIKNLNLLIKVI